jgi:hypothetical protein
VGAVELYGVAASCFALNGKDTDADKMRQAGAALEERIQEDYRTHRLKLEAGDPVQADPPGADRDPEAPRPGQGTSITPTPPG